MASMFRMRGCHGPGAQAPEGTGFRWLVAPADTPGVLEGARGRGWGLILSDGAAGAARTVHPAPRRDPSAEARARLMERALVRVLQGA